MPALFKCPPSSNARLLQTPVFFKCPSSPNAVHQEQLTHYWLQCRWHYHDPWSSERKWPRPLGLKTPDGERGRVCLKVQDLTSAVLKTFNNWTNLLWCGWARWQVGGTLPPEGSCSTRQGVSIDWLIFPFQSFTWIVLYMDKLSHICYESWNTLTFYLDISWQ